LDSPTGALPPGGVAAREQGAGGWGCAWYAVPAPPAAGHSGPPAEATAAPLWIRHPMWRSAIKGLRGVCRTCAKRGPGSRRTVYSGPGIAGWGLVAPAVFQRSLCPSGPLCVDSGGTGREPIGVARRASYGTRQANKRATANDGPVCCILLAFAPLYVTCCPVALWRGDLLRHVVDSRRCLELVVIETGVGLPKNPRHSVNA
jgi:hypothetical protein